jgi:hypothetical protein
VLGVNQPEISRGSARLWEHARALIEDAIARGWL